MITLTATPSLNKLKGKWALSNWKKKYIKELDGYVLVYGQAKVKRIVSITRYGSRILDIDNFMGGLKPLLDALKHHKLIVDDRAEYLTLEAYQLKTERGKDKIEADIYE